MEIKFPKNMPETLRAAHKEAKRRFEQDSSKCYQRHIRELYAETETHAPVTSLDGAQVRRVSNQEAQNLIWKYEWLHTMGAGTMACYGLFVGEEMLGVACFGKMGQKIGQICTGASPEETDQLAKNTACLQRGACVPWAPSNAASFLIRHACRLASIEFGWKIFFAFSDSDAGEVGTVYQASNWFYTGKVRGRAESSYHADYVSPDGSRTLTSYKINHGRKKLMEEFGVPSGVAFRTWLKSKGWRVVKHFAKGKYVWFEGTRREKELLKKQCRYAPQPYPKREKTNET